MTGKHQQHNAHGVNPYSIHDSESESYPGPSADEDLNRPTQPKRTYLPQLGYHPRRRTDSRQSDRIPESPNQYTYQRPIYRPPETRYPSSDMYGAFFGEDDNDLSEDVGRLPVANSNRYQPPTWQRGEIPSNFLPGNNNNNNLNNQGFLRSKGRFATPHLHPTQVRKGDPSNAHRVQSSLTKSAKPSTLQEVSDTSSLLQKIQQSGETCCCLC